MTQYEQSCQERLEKAIASVKFYDEFGFATVESTTKPGIIYFVDYDKNFYATACSCKGNAEYGKDCLHMLALCRAADDRRPDFYTMHGIQKLAKQQVEKPAVASEEETVEVMVGNTRIVAARRNIDNAVSHHQWGIDVIAAAEEVKAEAKMEAFKQGMDAQYSQAPSAWNLDETQASEMRHFYDAY